MPNQIDKLDIELYALIDSCDWDNKENYGAVTRKLVEQIKTTILKHYISREEVLGLLEDEGIYKDGLMIFSSDGEQEIISPSRIRNKLRAELRQALTTNVKE